jgi:hypothetical protein
MNRDEWIPVEVRKPTKEDADFAGCVLVWHLYNGCMVTGYHNVGENRFFTHWMPPPDAPEGAAKIKEDEIQYERGRHHLLTIKGY